MKWQDLIEANPDILAGKPVVKGTRLAVEFLLSLFAEGWTEQEVLENYPQLNRMALQAVFAFSAACLHDKQYFAQTLATLHAARESFPKYAPEQLHKEFADMRSEWDGRGWETQR